MTGSQVEWGRVQHLRDTAGIYAAHEWQFCCGSRLGGAFQDKQRSLHYKIRNQTFGRCVELNCMKPGTAESD